MFAFSDVILNNRFDLQSKVILLLYFFQIVWNIYNLIL